MTDFESRMLSALNQIYPGIPQVLCLFHLEKNVVRHVQDVGTTELPYGSNIHGNICMIPALSFVPVQLSMNFATIMVLMSSLFLIILKLNTSESYEGPTSAAVISS